MKKDDLIGRKLDMLTILDKKRENNRTFYYCRCDCGIEKWMRADKIKSGGSKSCGCYIKKKLEDRFVDLSGQKFNNWTVLYLYSKQNNSTYYYCKCDCGNERVVRRDHLLKGESKSCGCLKNTLLSNSLKKNWKKIAKNIYVEGTKINSLNRKTLNKNNTSGVTGVTWHNCGKWMAQIHFKNKRTYLGLYDNKEDAIKARKEAEERLHKEFLREKGIID